MKVQLGPTDIFFPVPAALIVSGSREKANVATVAWIGIMGSEPPVVGISLKSTRYSLDLIRKTKEFTVNIPSVDKFKEVDYCGLVSGRRRDKFDDTGFTPISSSKVDTPIIDECPFNMECRVMKGEVALGEWVVIFGEIVETHVDEDKRDAETKNVDIAKISPLVYCATVREYWELGRKLGKGFDAGKDFIQNQKD